MRINNTILKPIITEKSVSQATEYVFKVNKKASKGSVANEVEKLYGVNVVDVRTMIVRGKKKRLGRTNKYKTAENWKKAIVSLKDGQKIEVFEQK